jgi:hypothetical protein
VVLDSLPDLVIVAPLLGKSDITFSFGVAIMFALINGGGICSYILSRHASLRVRDAARTREHVSHHLQPVVGYIVKNPQRV